VRGGCGNRRRCADRGGEDDDFGLDRGATAHGELEPCLNPVEKDKKCKKDPYMTPRRLAQDTKAKPNANTRTLRPDKCLVVSSLSPELRPGCPRNTGANAVTTRIIYARPSIFPLHRCARSHSNINMMNEVQKLDIRCEEIERRLKEHEERIAKLERMPPRSKNAAKGFGAVGLKMATPKSKR
jgi:hypothetical protein